MEIKDTSMQCEQKFLNKSAIFGNTNKCCFIIYIKFKF